MAINFPTALDTLTNPTATDYLNSPSHAGQHSDANDAIEAIQAKLGINSSAVTTSHDYKLSLVAGTAKAIPDSYLDTDGTLSANSDVKLATQKAVKTYADTKQPKVRTTTEASSATPTINTDNTDIHTITALAEAITSMTTNLSGTPVNGQKLIVRIKDNGTARALSFGASFASMGATLPTTTILGKYLYIGFIFNSTTSKWDCMAVANEA